MLRLFAFFLGKQGDPKVKHLDRVKWLEEVGQGFTPGSLPCSVLLGSGWLCSAASRSGLSQAPADSREPLKP